MIDYLVDAVKCGRRWTDRFTRFEYREAFSEYTNTYAESFIKEMNNYSNCKDFADDYIRLVSESIKKEKFFHRGSCFVDCKMTVVAYFCPMIEEKIGHEAAESICDSWNRIYKNECIRSSDYNTILNGFRNSVLGIDFENKHNNE